MNSSASPNLPMEIIDEVAGHLPPTAVLSLALTAKAVYEVTIRHFYRDISVMSIRDGVLALKLQRASIECMKALLSDERKRQGVETLVFHGIGVLDVRIDDQEIMVPEPYSTQIKKRRSEWIKTQPIFSDLANATLSGNFEFIRLETLHYDGNALLNEHDAERLLNFLGRHPEIKNVIVNGDNTRPFNKLVFSRLPNDLSCRLTRLERAVIYGPLLPLLLGFSFSPSQTSDGYGPLVRKGSLQDTLPLKRVHLWWPQRVVRIVDVDEGDEAIPSRVTVDLDLFHVMNALSSVCRLTLEVLHIATDDEQMDEDLMNIVCGQFPNLRELSLGPAHSDPMGRLHNQTFLRRMAEKLGKLKHLERFLYSNVSEDVETSRLGNVLEQWDETLRCFADRCPALNYMQLYLLTWRRLTGTPSVHWG
ncbi:hypothetical protein APHAL10511_008257 [Amanita phalloides]|nr:hypothetical protein APHAL10511_008257 [Amanita phalloides]